MNKYANQDKYFSTSDFYCSVFLILKELQLVDIDFSDPNRALFVFLDNAKRKKLVQDFAFAQTDAKEVMVDARKFQQTSRLLKNRLYQDKNHSVTWK